VAGIERDSLLGIYRALFARSVPVDYVHAGHLSAETLARYKLVIFPYPVMVPESVAAPLRAYVASGGALVSEARLAWSNERGAAADRIPGLGLWDVMGARESAVQTAPGGKTLLTWTGAAGDLPGLSAGELLPGRWYEETLEPVSGSGRVVATFPSGAPAAVLSTHGRGKSLLLGSYVSAAYQTTPTPAAERFYLGLLQWAGVQVPVDVSGGPFEVRLLESGPDTLVFVLNHAADLARGTVSLRTRPTPTRATDLSTGQPIPVRRADTQVTIELEVGGADARVIRLHAAP
jgi:hypothetical protein